MKLFHLFLVLIVFGIFFCGAAQAAEKIDSFDVDIKINQDASIDVSERIEYAFGDQSKHGIFRFIPIKYEARGGNYNLRVSDIAVEDENGSPYNFETSYPGSNVEIKIGDAERLVSGKKTYVISYSVKRAINYFENYDELYWNVTGNEWPVAIEKSSATISIEGTGGVSLDVACYAGVFGSTGGCGDKEVSRSKNLDGSGSINNSVRLDPGSGMTIVVGWPKGIVKKPSVLELFWETFKDNWILIMPLVVLVGMYYLWLIRGKDPLGRGTVIAQYESPDFLAPAEVGTILDERADNKDVSASLIDLAIRGYLKIKKTEKKKLIFNSSDYELEKLKDGSELGNEFEKKLFNSIFGGKNTVKLSDLKDTFYKDLKKVQDAIYESVVAKGYFPNNPNSTKMMYVIFGIVVAAAAFFIGLPMGGLAIFSFILSGIIIVIFGLFMGVKTAKGVAAKEHIEGLKLYLGVAEKDRIDFHNAPEKNPERFEKFLPFAMVLGVEKAWAKQFEGIYNQQPSWYNDPGMTSFSAITLADKLGSFNSLASSDLASAPSSASGGGSGFSGGGSGGGFGGGGGGSW